MDSHWIELRRQIIDFCLNVCQVVEGILGKITLCGENGIYRFDKSDGLNKCAINEYTLKAINDGKSLYLCYDNGKLMISNVYQYYGISDTKFNHLFRKYGMAIKPIFINLRMKY